MTSIFKYFVFVLLSIGLNEINLKADTYVLTASPSVEATEVCFSDLFDHSNIEQRCPKTRTMCCPWSLGKEDSLQLTRTEIETKLLSAILGFDGNAVSGPMQVSVTSRTRIPKEEELFEQLKILSETHYGDSNWKLTGLLDGSALRVPKNVSWNLTLPAEPSSVISVLVQNIDTKQTIGWLRAKMALNEYAYISKRSIRTGEILNKKDFEYKIIDASQIKRAHGISFLKSEDFDSYKKAKYSIDAGKPVLSSMVERRAEVVYGDYVTLIMKSDNLRITTKGVVQGGGAIGDTVPVYLKQYQKTFRGKVVDGKQVEVWL